MTPNELNNLLQKIAASKPITPPPTHHEPTPILKTIQHQLQQELKKQGLTTNTTTDKPNTIQITDPITKTTINIHYNPHTHNIHTEENNTTNISDPNAIAQTTQQITRIITQRRMTR